MNDRFKGVTSGKVVKMLSLRKFSVCVSTVLICAGLSAAADLASAKRAYEEKDYATALKELTPLAQQGNADAQFLLGKMYWTGQGVLKDTEQAVKWLKASALHGNADAQFYMGSYYLLPRGPQVAATFCRAGKSGCSVAPGKDLHGRHAGSSA
jgi:hypothetical protein